MIPYATRTGTKRNNALMADGGWAVLLNPFCDLSPLPPGKLYAFDNGAWPAFTAGRPFDGLAFVRGVERVGAGAAFIVCPDIVMGGRESLAFTLQWLPFCLTIGPVVLIAVQDQMTVGDIVDLFRLYGRRIGIFVGGSTIWKEDTMKRWGTLARRLGIYCHVGRVNSVRRIALCAFAGVDSFDGTSASKFAVTIPKLTNATRQPDLFT